MANTYRYTRLQMLCCMITSSEKNRAKVRLIGEPLIYRPGQSNKAKPTGDLGSTSVFHDANGIPICRDYQTDAGCSHQVCRFSHVCIFYFLFFFYLKQYLLRVASLESTALIYQKALHMYIYK